MSSAGMWFKRKSSGRALDDEERSVLRQRSTLTRPLSLAGYVTLMTGVGRGGDTKAVVGAGDGMGGGYVADLPRLTVEELVWFTKGVRNATRVLLQVRNATRVLLQVI